MTLSSVWLGNMYENQYNLEKYNLNLGNEFPNPAVKTLHLITHFQFIVYTDRAQNNGRQVSGQNDRLVNLILSLSKSVFDRSLIRLHQQ